MSRARLAVARTTHTLLTNPRRVIAKPYLLGEGIVRGGNSRAALLMERNFERVAHHIPPGAHLTRERRLLVGAYFTHEYLVEAAALFNPSGG